jgi:hypothetical protein
MSAAVYGPKERSRLATLADQLATAPGGGELAAVIADKLRTELPDLDDLTIGRVLIVLTTEMPTLFMGVADVATTWQGLTSAGLSMTEPEWKDL